VVVVVVLVAGAEAVKLVSEADDVIAVMQKKIDLLGVTLLQCREKQNIDPVTWYNTMQYTEVESRSTYSTSLHQYFIN